MVSQHENMCESRITKLLGEIVAAPSADPLIKIDASVSTQCYTMNIVQLINNYG